MTLVLEIPDSWKVPLGLDKADAAGRAREMLVIESYREGKLSRGQAAEMLGLVNGVGPRGFTWAEWVSGGLPFQMESEQPD